MINFDDLPDEIRFQIFELSKQPILPTACISKHNRIFIEDLAERCFLQLAIDQENTSFLKSSIENIQYDESLSGIGRITQLYRDLKNAGYDDKRAFLDLCPEKIRNAFEELQIKRDHALIKILPIIAKQAGLHNPALQNAQKARAWFKQNLVFIEKIKNLTLSELDLEVLPLELKELSKLQLLNISKNKLKTLPQELGELPVLETLNVSHNQFRSLSVITSLINLRHLNASYNRVKSLVPEIGRLTKLQELHLSHNTLHTLPPELGQLTKLQVLGLHANELSVLPQEISLLIKLRSIFVHDNKLTTLPLQMEPLIDLQELHLSKNRLTTLPKSIGMLPALKLLGVSSNPKLILPLLPSRICVRRKIAV